MNIDTEYMVAFLKDLLNIHSPTGFAGNAVEFVRQALVAYPFLQVTINNKGALVVRWEGKNPTKVRAITSHIDTLGAMVKDIKPNGRPKISRIGGLQLTAVETEGCWVMTQSGKAIRGSLQFEDASAHVHAAKVAETIRNENNMEIRLDAITDSPEETRALGIEVGDFVCFDPRVEITNGFIRSRFLDDKACVAAVVAAIKTLAEAGKTPEQTTVFHFSNYEEVGHGASVGIPANAHELLTVDMAAIGAGQTSDEMNVTLCVKDSGGPYHHGFSNKLRKLADKAKLPYKVDIYPYYGSDGEAFWRAGGDIAVALIGPGVDASHGYERTHTTAVENTAKWIVAYLLSD